MLGGISCWCDIAAVKVTMVIEVILVKALSLLDNRGIVNQHFVWEH